MIKSIVRLKSNEKISHCDIIPISSYQKKLKFAISNADQQQKKIASTLVKLIDYENYFFNYFQCFLCFKRRVPSFFFFLLKEHC